MKRRILKIAAFGAILLILIAATTAITGKRFVCYKWVPFNKETLPKNSPQSKHFVGKKGLFFGDKLITVVDKEEDILPLNDDQVLAIDFNNLLFSFRRITSNNMDTFSKQLLLRLDDSYSLKSNVFQVGNDFYFLSYGLRQSLYRLSENGLTEIPLIQSFTKSCCQGPNDGNDLKLLFSDKKRAVLIVAASTLSTNKGAFWLFQIKRDRLVEPIFKLEFQPKANPCLNYYLYRHPEEGIVQVYPEDRILLFNFYQGKLVQQVGLFDLDRGEKRIISLKGYSFPIIGAALCPQCADEGLLILFSLNKIYFVKLSDGEVLADIDFKFVRELGTSYSGEAYSSSAESFLRVENSCFKSFPLKNNKIGFAVHEQLSFELDPQQMAVEQREAFKPGELSLPVIYQEKRILPDRFAVLPLYR